MLIMYIIYIFEFMGQVLDRFELKSHYLHNIGYVAQSVRAQHS
jgi:TRAP-type mannitol/chloroaromatic compound transport system permease large subunit